MSDIQITPYQIDLGSIADDVQVPIQVRNLHSTNALTVYSALARVGSGLTVTGPALPLVIAPLGSAVFILRVTGAGQERFDEPVNWSTSVALPEPMRVTGWRATGWRFDPAWPPTGNEYRIEYEFKTESIRSHSGKEQRIALRSTPRRQFNHAIHLSGNQLRDFKGLMWKRQSKTFVLAEMTRSALSSGAMGEGTLVMAVSPLPGWVVPGAIVMLRSRPNRDSYREVAAVSGQQVTFKTADAQNWPVGTQLLAAALGYVSTELSAPRLTNSAANLSMGFQVLPAKGVTVRPPVAAQVFNGRELFLKKPNWANPVGSEQGHDVSDIDYGRGPVARFVPIQFGYETRKAVYVNRNREEAQQILDLFLRMKGQQGEFYAPSWEPDIVPAGTSPANTATLRVGGTQLWEQYADSTVHKALFVQLLDGTLITRKVLSIAQVSSVDGPSSQVTVDGNWGAIVGPQTVAVCGWLYVRRLASDQLTLEWLTDGVAQTQLTMITLEDLPPETA